jgi:hypothetical protein
VGRSRATFAPLEKEIARGEHQNAADFRTAGTGATVPKGHPTEMGGPSIPTLKPDDDIQSFVDARFADGSDYLKIMYEHAYPTLSLEQLRALVLAAHKRNKLAVAHESKQFEGMAEMQAGVDGVEHIFDDVPITREIIETAVPATWCSPRLYLLFKPWAGIRAGPRWRRTRDSSLSFLDGLRTF